MEKSIENNSLNRREFLKTVTNKSIETILGFSILSNLNCKSDSIEIPRRILGRTKLSVSLLGFGCTQIKDKMVYQRAIDLGINYFHMGDRDPTYNLDACAALLPFRQNIHIAYMSHPKDSKDILMEDLDNFLQQSRFGFLDVWFVITPSPEVLNAFCEAADIAKKSGKIRWTGITTHSLNRDVDKLTASDSIIDVVMMTYNYLSPAEHSEILEKFYAAGLGITPMKPLAGKFYEKTTSKPDALLRWLVEDNRIHSIPVIMTKPDQVDQNVAAVKQKLSKDDRNNLQSMYSYNSQRFCRMCGACDGKCPVGLSVSDLVRTAMYIESYRDINLAKSNLSLIHEKNRQIACNNCENCAVICPNGVAIKERISSVKEWLG